ncbi:YjjW family glycine radical enzyme activase [Geosporobacter ferrireducens]|uniref:YjjW family glycine radical enzyme activase n=1 Tax=Geosporobacter ferrireducens TaxID=1424294 RepID=UPI00139BAFE3|nr:YjjW family glycine radical enzyme activase [Geosporobacter ferrireducens]MTI54664.1 YjjW family glycine radical enzyme activase [Geosporobacter ferrireducens]
MKPRAVVNKIIPFSNVDGPGNRLAVFLQGCNINCVYCHNPETIKHCNHCGICINHCPTKAIKLAEDKVTYEEGLCIGCDQCIKICGFSASPRTKEYTVEALYKVIEGYAPFIRGITVSGGEPTLQADFIAALFKRVKGLNLSCFVDTNGFFDRGTIKELITVTDQFMIDIKAIDKIAALCGREDQQHLENLQYLLSLHKVYEVRTVIALEMVDIENTLGTVAKILRNYPSVAYKLISVHTTGLTPIQKENIKNKIPSQAYMEELKAYVTTLGVKKVEIV